MRKILESIKAVKLIWLLPAFGLIAFIFDGYSSRSKQDRIIQTLLVVGVFIGWSTISFFCWKFYFYVTLRVLAACIVLWILLRKIG